jgi:hypothetical protein
MKLTSEQGRSLVYNDLEGWDAVTEEEIVDTSRWSVFYSRVYKHIGTNKFYEMGYSSGATEQQDERPFEYDDPVLVEVKSVPTMVIKWLPKGNR